MGAYFQDVYDHTLRLLEQVDLHRDIVSGVMDAVVAQTSNRLNQVMKTLTVISTMLMSASLVAGVYGMNFKFMPELEVALRLLRRSGPDGGNRLRSRALLQAYRLVLG